MPEPKKPTIERKTPTINDTGSAVCTICEVFSLSPAPMLWAAVIPHPIDRPIKRFISRNIESLIANSIINDEININSNILIDVDNDKLILKKNC